VVKLGKRKNSKNSGISILIVFGSFILLSLLEYILIVLAVAAIIFIFGLIAIYLINIVGKIKLKRQYERSQYYIDTQIPFKRINKKGHWFEFECYEAIIKGLDYKCKIINNIIIPRLDSINEYAEIDLLIFHYTGIYVLELKDYKGYVYGKKENIKWNVGYSQNYKNKKTYEFYNPIKQNEGHIQDLNKIKPFNYINYVIFSNSMVFNSYISNVVTINKFIDDVKTNQMLSNNEIMEVKQIYQTLKKYDLSNDESVKEQHVMRQEYNRRKYISK
jgi:hypothetical protein